MHASHAHARTRRFWLALACALCLLGFQGVGHWHRVAHIAGLAGVPLTLNPAGALVKADVWGHQSGDADCHLFDQLSHDHAPGSAALPACAAIDPVLPVAQVLASADTAAHWKRGARGPPLSA